MLEFRILIFNNFYCECTKNHICSNKVGSDKESPHELSLSFKKNLFFEKFSLQAKSEGLLLFLPDGTVEHLWRKQQSAG